MPVDKDGVQHLTEIIGTDTLIETLMLGRGVECFLEGVYRYIRRTEEGRVYSYVLKPLRSVLRPFTERETFEKNKSVYEQFQAANIPVVNELKMVREYGDLFLYMEDLTKRGEYDTFDLGGLNPPSVDTTIGVIEESAHPRELQEDMVESLAVVHNLGIAHTHPGTSFLLRRLKADPRVVNYRVIDYSNFNYEGAINEDSRNGFYYHCKYGIEQLLKFIALQNGRSDELKELYEEIRRSGKMGK